jgi:hypothetical protein
MGRLRDLCRSVCDKKEKTSKKRNASVNYIFHFSIINRYPVIYEAIGLAGIVVVKPTTENCRI